MTRQCTTLAAFAALLLTACSGGNGDDAAAKTDSAAAAVAPAPAAAPAPALDDPTIVAIFDAANTADIETGRLAAERGKSAEVRAFGAMLARDHESVRKQGRDLAQRLGVTPTPPADDASARAHAQAMETLRAKQGDDFDRAFLDHEVKFHQDVIDAVNGTLLPAIQNAEVRTLVVTVAPAFEAHRAAAAKLREKIGA